MLTNDQWQLQVAKFNHRLILFSVDSVRGTSKKTISYQYTKSESQVTSINKLAERNRSTNHTKIDTKKLFEL